MTPRFTLTTILQHFLQRNCAEFVPENKDLHANDTVYEVWSAVYLNSKNPEKCEYGADSESLLYSNMVIDVTVLQLSMGESLPRHRCGWQENCWLSCLILINKELLFSPELCLLMTPVLALLRHKSKSAWNIRKYMNSSPGTDIWQCALG